MSAWPTGNKGLAVQLVTDREGTRVLENEWASLPPPAAAPCPMTGPAFFQIWLDTLGVGSSPRIVVGRRGGRVVGVLPLVACSGTAREGGRQVRLVGSRRPPILDMADVWIEPGEELPLAGAFVELLERRASTWDTLYLGNIAEAGRTMSALRALAEGRGWPLVSRHREAAVVDTSGSWQEYRRRLTRTMRSLPRRARHGDNGGLFRFEPRLIGAPGAAALQDLFRLYRVRWGAANCLEDGVYRECLMRLYASQEPHGSYVAGLWSGERPVALLLVFVQGDREQWLISGADRDRSLARYSPGALLTYLMLERAFAAETREVHLLHTITPSKVAWANSFAGESICVALSPGARLLPSVAFPAIEAAVLGQRIALRRRARSS